MSNLSMMMGSHNEKMKVLMNLDRFEEALPHFLQFKHVPEALQYAAQCYQALNGHRQASACLEALKSMQKNP